jgi:hypothetical protein
VEARTGVLIGVASFVAPVLGGMVNARSERACMMAATAMASLQLPLLLWSEETLGKEKRRRFGWRKAEPLGNLLILFKGGRDLRNFAFSELIRSFAAGCHSLQSSFNLGVLGFSASHESYFRSIQSVFTATGVGAMSVPMMKYFGSKRCFEMAGHSSTLAMLVISQSHRPTSVPYQLVALMLAYLINMPSQVAGVAGRETMLARARKTTTAGSGELSAALTGATSLLGVITPLWWGHWCVHTINAPAL